MAEGAPVAGLPAGDPRTATYNDELATLQHQQENALSSDAAARAEAQTAYKFGISQYNAAEPKALTAEQNQANSQGLLESGINAQRRGGVLSSYVEKRGQLTTREQQTEDRLNRADQQAREAYSTGAKTAADRALENYKREQLALNPNEAQPATPAAVRQPAPPAVISGRAQPRSSIRQRAARRVVR